MDSAHTPPSPSCSTSTIAHATSNPRFPTSSTAPIHSKRYSEPTPSRQRRLLQNRNARFSAKRLSLSNLGSRSSQLILANDETPSITAPIRGQENAPIEPHSSELSIRRHSSTNVLESLDGTTNSARDCRSKQIDNITVYEDTSERHSLEYSPFSLPAAYLKTPSQDCSPIAFDHIEDTMRLREISGNELRRSPLTSSPYNASIKAAKKRKSMHVNAGFDSQEYIDHIEKELAEARSEMFSPTSNRSLKDQLKVTRSENEKLRQDMVDMREAYEAEVKRNIEHRAEMEVELKRKVRDLEEEVEQKICIIRDLELLHDERRLDNNTIDTLKAAIERLEQDKSSLENENRSIGKRNEVLSELLAMSPTKPQSFELRSPVRDKRGVRPMSMIIPRQPSSPNGRQLSQPASVAVSPSANACGPFFSPTRSRMNSPTSTGHGLGLNGYEVLDPISRGSGRVEQGYFDYHHPTRSQSRRSTLQSHASTNDAASCLSSSSPIFGQGPQKLPPKRKPRKFMSGSTQLKPLLLPALTGDSISTSALSAASSPRIETRRDFSEDSIDPTTYFLSRPEEVVKDDNLAPLGSPGGEITEICSEDSTAIYRNMEDIMAEHEVSLTSNCSSSLHLASETQPQSHVLNEDYFEQHQKPKNCAVRVGNSISLSNMSCSLGDNDQFAVISCVDELNRRDIKEPQPHPVGIDIHALGQLGLPDPDYDMMPDRLSDADSTLIIDRPQPLFSFATNPNRSPLRVVATSSSRDQIRPSWGESTTYLDSSHKSGPTCHSLESWDMKKCFHQHPPTEVETSTSHSSVLPMGTRTQHRVTLAHRSSAGVNSHFSHSKSPVDLLRSGKLGARPLAALTIRTIFGTISSCTTQVRDFRKDPLALARRVLANVWMSNWSRFGKMSWWVLGLFFSTGLGRGRAEARDWEEYDGEEIARRVCLEREASDESRAITTQQTIVPSLAGLQGRKRDNLLPSSTQSKTGWTKSLLLWGKFSVAIMLAVGGAVVRGPGAMLNEVEGDEDDNLDERCCSGCCSDSNRNRCQSNENSLHAQDDLRHGTWRTQSGRQQTPPGLIRNQSSPMGHSVHPSESFPCHTARKSQQMRQPFHLDEDETLRAIKSPRKHVAEFFQQGGVKNIQTNHRSIRYSGQYNRALHCSSSSINSGAVNWPPSPGTIYPENDHFLHERHF